MQWIVAAKWQIFYAPVSANIQNVEKHTLACLSFHSYLPLTGYAPYCPFALLNQLTAQAAWRKRNREP